MQGIETPHSLAGDTVTESKTQLERFPYINAASRPGVKNLSFSLHQRMVCALKCWFPLHRTIDISSNLGVSLPQDITSPLPP